MRAEPLETRRLLAVLTVDNSDPDAANVPGDKLYAEIQEAVDAASPSDQIKVEAGIYKPFVVNKDNLTIREAKPNSNPVVDADGGVFDVVIGADGVTVRGLEARNATRFTDPGASYAFLVIGNNNTLIDNLATDSNQGFLVVASDGNRLIGNTALGNASGFAVVFGAENNTLHGNTANDNQSEGFAVVFGANHNTLIGNTAERNGTLGFNIQDGVTDTTLKENRANENDIGFLAFETHGTRFTANHAERNLRTGFDIEKSTDATLTGNQAKDNLSNGFFMMENIGVRLTGNHAAGNGRDGFQVVLNLNLTVIGNTADNNARDGFLVVGVYDSTFTGNTASGNGEDGFSIDKFAGFFPASSGNVFNGNEARDNGRFGVYVDPALLELDNVFRGMACEGNGLDGSNLMTSARPEWSTAD